MGKNFQIEGNWPNFHGDYGNRRCDAIHCRLELHVYSLRLPWTAVRGASTPSVSTSFGRRSSTRRRLFVDERQPCSSPVLYSSRRRRHPPSPSSSASADVRWKVSNDRDSHIGCGHLPSTDAQLNRRRRRPTPSTSRRRSSPSSPPPAIGAGTCHQRLRTLNTDTVTCGARLVVPEGKSRNTCPSPEQESSPPPA